jgi:hypothetical protein
MEMDILLKQLEKYNERPTGVLPKLWREVIFLAKYR